MRRFGAVPFTGKVLRCERGEPGPEPDVDEPYSVVGVGVVGAVGPIIRRGNRIVDRTFRANECD
jgi:hypothetical protein